MAKRIKELFSKSVNAEDLHIDLLLKENDIPKRVNRVMPQDPKIIPSKVDAQMEYDQQ